MRRTIFVRFPYLWFILAAVVAGNDFFKWDPGTTNTGTMRLIIPGVLTVLGGVFTFLRFKTKPSP
jgi:hypothetical protein